MSRVRVSRPQLLAISWIAIFAAVIRIIWWLNYSSFLRPLFLWPGSADRAKRTRRLFTGKVSESSGTPARRFKNLNMQHKTNTGKREHADAMCIIYKNIYVLVTASQNFQAFFGSLLLMLRVLMEHVKCFHFKFMSLHTVCTVHKLLQHHYRVAHSLIFAQSGA